MTRLGVGRGGFLEKVAVPVQEEGGWGCRPGQVYWEEGTGARLLDPQGQGWRSGMVTSRGAGDRLGGGGPSWGKEAAEGFAGASGLGVSPFPSLSSLRGDRPRGMRRKDARSP